MSDSDDDEIPMRVFDEENNKEDLNHLEIEKAREIMNDFNQKDVHREVYDELKIMREYLEVEKNKISDFEKERNAAYSEL